MKMKRLIQASKVLKVFVAIIFASTLLPATSYAQMPAAPTAAAEAVAAPKEMKGALATAGNVTVNFKDVDIKTVLHYLSEVSGVDIVPSPGVEGTVTMRLRDKPWEVALDIITRNYGFVYSREGDIIRVIPKAQLNAEEPVTEVITLNHLLREIEIKKEEEGEEVTVETKQESIEQLMKAINAVLDARRGEKATYISSVNSVVVTAIPSRINAVKDMILAIDRKSPQIVLDCKVIEITLDTDERFGVDWNAVITAAGAQRPITFPFMNTGGFPLIPSEQKNFYPTSVPSQSVADFPLTLLTAIAAPTANGLFQFGTLDFSTFTATLSLLEERGDTEILSSPRITTLNNQKATIKVIDKIMFQKSIESTEAARTVTVEFEEEDEAREVGVKLAVIPHVNEEGDISVNLLPEVSTNQGVEPLSISATDTTYSLTFSSREANTIVRVRDGETIFLGGLIKKDITKVDNKLPILGDLFGGIPVIGSAFKYESEDVDRTEIVFFVTVHVVKDALDSIVDAQSTVQYEKYIQDVQDGKADRFGSPIKQGKIKTSQKQVEVHTTPLEAEETKDAKPFLDFRKKK